ncbi:UDP-glucose--hexose-1-phosphate uridylyltransferase [Paenibacillus sp. P26]|nr:UDP-glucose--hexose-1-phosphate uridylyltransferase [Paenibacillus sp. P26]
MKASRKARPRKKRRRCWSRLLDYAAETGLLEENTTTLRDLLEARIMGMLMPRESELVRRFWTTAKTEGAERATDDFYRLCIDSNYIPMARIRKNLYWLAPTEYGELEITVNLSKPEKDPKEIAMLRSAPQSHYPKCLLCIENVGYAGRLNHPARQNLRVIPLELSGDPWFFQYSPYVYYNEHSIIFDREHRPMTISKDSFGRSLDFIDQFPHYFIGSNADLPIVGGSILNHDHFQGGRHVFPMEKAPVEESFSHPDYPGLKLGIVKWPMSVIRISSHSRTQLLKVAGDILDVWKQHSDPENEIYAFTERDGVRTPHHTITPIARNNATGEYEMDLVLRDNRTSDEFPDGIFHPHPELHHIKKENIGLIEVMGLAILPGRLKGELEQIARRLPARTRWMSGSRRRRSTRCTSTRRGSGGCWSGPAAGLRRRRRSNCSARRSAASSRTYFATRASTSGTNGAAAASGRSCSVSALHKRDRGGSPGLRPRGGGPFLCMDAYGSGLR